MKLQLGTRSENFAERSHNRYWWFRNTGATYVPPIFRLLTDDEWEVMDAWYTDTEQKFQSTGECSIPAISALMGFIAGSNISRIVQLGHFVGFSTLLLGFLQRYMGHKRGLISFDIDPNVTAYTAEWVRRAGLDPHVSLVVSDSSAATAPTAAMTYLGEAPQLVFIDSSHQYLHTLEELSLWYGVLAPGGMIFLHDVSEFAAAFDGTASGGVARAAAEWIAQHDARAVLLNRDVTARLQSSPIYADGCGLGIIQKPLS